jgi:hypothetical protein
MRKHGQAVKRLKSSDEFKSMIADMPALDLDSLAKFAGLLWKKE